MKVGLEDEWKNRLYIIDIFYIGGELGYALAVSFGAVLDNPDLIATCLVGGKY